MKRLKQIEFARLAFVTFCLAALGILNLQCDSRVVETICSNCLDWETSYQGLPVSFWERELEQWEPGGRTVYAHGQPGIGIGTYTMALPEWRKKVTLNGGIKANVTNSEIA